MRSYELTLSKRGLPCLWESGGGFSNTGEVKIITNAQFESKVPIFVRQSGQLANGDHALIPVRVGDHIVAVYRHRNDFKIWVYQIKSLDTNANAELVYEFSNGEWNQTPPETATNAINAAKAKASDYHCRKPYFIKLPEKVS